MPAPPVRRNAASTAAEKPMARTGGSGASGTCIIAGDGTSPRSLCLRRSRMNLSTGKPSMLSLSLETVSPPAAQPPTQAVAAARRSRASANDALKRNRRAVRDGRGPVAVRAGAAPDATAAFSSANRSCAAVVSRWRFASRLAFSNSIYFHYLLFQIVQF